MLRAELKANALKGDQKEFHLGKGNTANTTTIITTTRQQQNGAAADGDRFSLA